MNGRLKFVTRRDWSLASWARVLEIVGGGRAKDGFKCCRDMRRWFVQVVVGRGVGLEATVCASIGS